MSIGLPNVMWIWRAGLSTHNGDSRLGRCEKINPCERGSSVAKSPTTRIPNVATNKAG